MQYRMGATSLATVVSMLLFSAIVPTNSSNAWVAMGLVAQNTLQMLISTAFLMAIFYLGDGFILYLTSFLCYEIYRLLTA